jgi:hypothetical protein
VPTAVVGHHARTAGGLHPVRTSRGQDPCPTTGARTPQTAAGQRRGRQGIQQQEHPDVSAAARDPARDPEKSDHRTARRNRGSRGGRPAGFDKARYRARSPVERAINKLKQFRAVATRYDKRGYVYLGTVTAAALLIWLRT